MALDLDAGLRRGGANPVHPGTDHGHRVGMTVQALMNAVEDVRRLDDSDLGQNDVDLRLALGVLMVRLRKASGPTDTS